LCLICIYLLTEGRYNSEEKRLNKQITYSDPLLRFAKFHKWEDSDQTGSNLEDDQRSIDSADTNQFNKKYGSGFHKSLNLLQRCKSDGEIYYKRVLSRKRTKVIVFFY
jgi:hypothetical protein